MPNTSLSGILQYFTSLFQNHEQKPSKNPANRYRFYIIWFPVESFPSQN